MDTLCNCALLLVILCPDPSCLHLGGFWNAIPARTFLICLMENRSSSEKLHLFYFSIEKEYFLKKNPFPLQKKKISLRKKDCL